MKTSRFIILFLLILFSANSIFAGRYYDPRTGRWLSVDPKAAKYPGLSPYNYCLNNPLRNIDPDGKDVIVLNSPKGASGYGHAAVLIGNDKNGWKYYSKDGSSSSIKIYGKSIFDNGRSFSSLSDFSKTVNSESNHQDKPYTNAYQISTDEGTDKKMTEAAIKQGENNYNLSGASCIDLVSDALEAGGLNSGTQLFVDPKTGIIYEGKSSIPNERYKVIKQKNKGRDVSNQLKNTEDDKKRKENEE